MKAHGSNRNLPGPAESSKLKCEFRVKEQFHQQMCKNDEVNNSCQVSCSDVKSSCVFLHDVSVLEMSTIIKLCWHR